MQSYIRWALKIKKVKIYWQNSVIEKKFFEKNLKKIFFFEKIFVFYFLVLSYVTFHADHDAKKISSLAGLELEKNRCMSLVTFLQFFFLLNRNERFIA